MNAMTRLLALSLVLLNANMVTAQLALNATEIDNLGIEFSIPKRVDSVSAIDALAHVVVPPNGEIVISTPQAGLVARLLVSNGDIVIKGDVLAEISSAEFVIRQREYLDAVIQNNLASRSLTRDQQLFTEGIISKRRLEDTQARAATAKARYEEHHQILRFSGLDNAAIQALGNHQKFQEALMLRAPIDGIVLETMTVTGKHIDAMDAAYRIADLSSLWLEIEVPHERMSGVVPGTPVSMAGTPDRAIAKVTSIGRTVDAHTQMSLVRATIVHEHNNLLPGQFVSVNLATEFPMSSNAPVWAVPTSALVRSDAKSFVFVRTAEGFARQEVLLVGSDSTLSFVSGDLDTATRVVIHGVAALKAHWSAETEPES